MPVPLRITLRHVRPTQHLRELIRERVETLERFHPRLEGCRVLVEMPHRHRTAGNRYHVRIELKVPGEVIILTHDPTVRGALPDEDGARMTKADEADVVFRYLHVAVHAAFEAAQRRLRDVARLQNGKVKAKVARIRRRRAG